MPLGKYDGDNPERAKIRASLRYELKGDEIRAALRLKYRENPDKYISKSAAYNKKIRIEAFIAYGGPTCACCGETQYEFLTLDHKNGGGNAHRERVGGVYQVFLELRRQGWPPGYRVLCWNCNAANAYHSVCPHQRKEL